MSSSTSKTLIFTTLALLAAGMYFAATQFSTIVEQENDPMSDFKASQQVAPPAPSNQDSNSDLAPVEVMLVGLRQRLEAQPNDVDGWVLLSKSYYHLERWQQAEAAFEKAKSLGYVGRWQPLPRIDAFSENSSSSQNFTSTIDYRDYRNKVAGSGAVSKEPTGLQLKVSLDPALNKEVSAESPVFVFVRAADNPGPPLAVVRKVVADLPFEIALNDSHAMIPGRTISSASNVIVGARISISGNVERRSGDYEQLLGPIPVNSGKTLDLVINDKIQDAN